MLPFIFCFSYFPFNDVCFTFYDLQISGCWGADWDETGLYVALWVFLHVYTVLSSKQRSYLWCESLFFLIHFVVVCYGSNRKII